MKNLGKDIKNGNVTIQEIYICAREQSDDLFCYLFYWGIIASINEMTHDFAYKQLEKEGLI